MYVLFLETTDWIREVRSQITAQDKVAFEFWKKQANAQFRHNKGLSVADYLDRLMFLGIKANKRTKIHQGDDDIKENELLAVSTVSLHPFIV